MSHTPGPWEVVGSLRDGQCRRIFAGDEYVAIVGGSDQTMQMIKANAQLIASAPDMLEIVSWLADATFVGESDMTRIVKQCKQIKAAIAESEEKS
ncbi:hypothetical protein SH449x_000768 [Pirellulaceae bacterium SH449]